MDNPHDRVNFTFQRELLEVCRLWLVTAVICVSSSHGLPQQCMAVHRHAIPHMTVARQAGLSAHMLISS